MLNFTMISGLFARTSSRASNNRRRAKASLGLESLEGRELLSTMVPKLGWALQYPAPTGSGWISTHNNPPGPPVPFSTP